MSRKSDEELLAFKDFHSTSGCQPLIDDCAICWVEKELAKYKRLAIDLAEFHKIIARTPNVSGCREMSMAALDIYAREIEK